MPTDPLGVRGLHQMVEYDHRLDFLALQYGA